MSLNEAVTSRDAVCAVVVTFNPDAGLGGRVARIAAQAAAVVIVDNASAPPSAGLDAAAAAGAAVTVIRNARNIGVAAALNQGVEWAAARGYAWVWLFDQDSLPREDMLARIFEVHAGVPAPAEVALVGDDHANAHAWSGQDAAWALDPRWVERKSVITSGSLLAVPLFRRLGPFREDFFIDHVDTEYCLRARSKGLRVLALREPLLQHTIGTPSVHRVGWRPTTTSNHTPTRRFHMTRNLICVVRMYGATEPAWALGAVWAWWKATVLMVAFERNRAEKLRAVAAGISAGLRMTTHGP